MSSRREDQYINIYFSKLCIVSFLRGGPFFSGFFNGLFWAPPTLCLGAMLDPGGGTGTGTNLFHDHFVCLLAIGKSLSD